MNKTKTKMKFTTKVKYEKPLWRDFKVKLSFNCKPAV